MNHFRVDSLEQTITDAMTELADEVRRLREALETITRSHPNLVTRGGQPAPWLVAKATLLDIPLSMSTDALYDAVIAEWSKTEPKVKER
jgi:hypothetical protein